MEASVLLIDPKYDFNVGGALRACAIFGAESLLWTGIRVKGEAIGERLPREERLTQYKHVYRSPVRDEYALKLAGRKQLTPVAVEVRENAEPLDTFIHPENAVYVFGPEDGTLGRRWLEACHRFVVIPSEIRSPLSLQNAVNVVLADRYMKNRRAKVEGRTYEVVVCNFCGRQAEWRQRDRMTYSWQCPNQEHGYKYLSLQHGTARKIITVPAYA